jgi:hypothetical protein
MKGFGTFASKAENGFVALRNCFMTVSRQPDRAEADQQLFCKDEHAVIRTQLARAMRSPRCRRLKSLTRSRQNQLPAPLDQARLSLRSIAR